MNIPRRCYVAASADGCASRRRVKIAVPISLVLKVQMLKRKKKKKERIRCSKTTPAVNGTVQQADATVSWLMGPTLVERFYIHTKALTVPRAPLQLRRRRFSGSGQKKQHTTKRKQGGY